MPWTIEEIENEWLRGEHLELPAEDVRRAFITAEAVRGKEWVLSTTHLPGGHRLWGFSALWPVYWFGKRIEAVKASLGVDALQRNLARNDPAADSELTAIYILRNHDVNREVEIEPTVVVGAGHRRPDFRIRDNASPWTYVEVTRLNTTLPSEHAQELVSRIAKAVVTVEKPFILEIVLWNALTEEEEKEVVQIAQEMCNMEEASRKDIGQIASVLIKTGDPSVVETSAIRDDTGTRICAAHSIPGPEGLSRQVAVRAPFADQRAEAILTAKAKQLPRQESGLVMVDVGGQPTAIDSWPKLIPPRFTTSQHTRVSGVLLFMTGITLTKEGLRGLTYLKLVPNPHARFGLASWITELVDKNRAENQRITSWSD